MGRVSDFVAFKGEDYCILRSRIDPGSISGWHHHGENHVYGYVVSGHVHLEKGPGGRGAISVAPGDFFSVPSHTVHRVLNPSSEEGGEVILFLRGVGEPIINVDALQPI